MNCFARGRIASREALLRLARIRGGRVTSQRGEPAPGGPRDDDASTGRGQGSLRGGAERSVRSACTTIVRPSAVASRNKPIAIAE